MRVSTLILVLRPPIQNTRDITRAPRDRNDETIRIPTVNRIASGRSRDCDAQSSGCEAKEGEER